MLIDLRKHPEAADQRSEICVIGAGAAGVTLTRRLAELGREVCLLESGGLDFEPATQNLYRGANIGMTYYDLDQARLRFFGGTVSIWGGRCALLDPIDFESRDWVPHSGWPIGRADLDPYYRKAHDQLELGEFNYENDVWRSLGVSAEQFDPAKLDLALWRFDELSERFAASRARDLIEHPKVRILLHANAVRLQAGADARDITSVEVRSIDGAPRQVRADRYVLACGAIENSRLMLASNDVEPAGVGNRHDQVGRFFMEHPGGRIGKVETTRPYEMWAAFQKRFMRAEPPLAPVLKLSEDVQRDQRALNSVVTFKLQRPPARGVAVGNALYHNLKHAIAPSQSGRALNHAYRAIRAWLHQGVRGTVERLRAQAGVTGLYLIMRGEQAPNPDSRVVLSAERDVLGSPRADLDWRLSDIDKHTARVFAATFDDELRRLGDGGLTPSAWLADPTPEWPVDSTVGNHPIGGYHHLGGTRMSDDPAKGVVDAEGRVHGYANLYVAGSSVFATGGWANPTLTIIALSLRLADHLAGPARQGSQ